MNQAIDAYRGITASPEFQERERMRSKTRHNEASALGHARREGEKEGRLDVAKTALAENLPHALITKLTGFSLEEVERLAAESKH